MLMDVLPLFIFFSGLTVEAFIYIHLLLHMASVLLMMFCWIAGGVVRIRMFWITGSVIRIRMFWIAGSVFRIRRSRIRIAGGVDGRFRIAAVMAIGTANMTVSIVEVSATAVRGV